MRTLTKYWAVVVALSMALAVPANAQSTLERIAIQVLAAKFGINTTDVVRMQQTSGLSLYDVAPIFSASSYGRTKADTVWELRRQGLGWGQVAHRIGMQPGQFNKLRNAGAFDSGRIWSGAIGSRFAVPVSTVTAVQKRGASLQDIIGSILIAKATNRSPQSVYDEYQRAKDWEPVRTKYDVQFERWQTYAKKPQSVRSGKVTPAGKAKGHDHTQGHGKGNSGLKGKGKGNSQGHGKGHGG